MKLEALTVRGFMTAFAGKEVTVPIGQLPDGLIAFTGDNGAGKSTLLEAAAAGVYRQFMSRAGDLKSYAQDRDSSIETSWQIGGAFYQSRLTVDGIKGGASAALWKSGDTIDKLNDGKVSTFDDAVAKIFPPVHVFKASAFAAQDKSGSFVKASKKERRDIFAAFLNLDRLVVMSETAKLAGNEVDQVRLRVRAAIELLERETAAAVVDELRRTKAGLDEERAGHERRRDELTTAIADLERQLVALSDSTAATAAAEQQVAFARERLTAAERELQTHVDAGAIAAAAETAELQRLTVEHDRRLRSITDRESAIANTHATALHHLETENVAKLADIEERLKGNAQIQAKKTEIEAAVAELAQLRPRYQGLKKQSEQQYADERRIADELAAAEKALTSFVKPEQELRLARVNAALLADVPCGGAGAFAACQFLVNAADARARIAELEQTVAGMTDAIAQRDRLVEAKQVALQALASTKSELVQVDERMTTLERSAQYADALKVSTERIKDLELLRADTIADREARTIAAKAVRDEGAAALACERAALEQDIEAATSALRARVDARVADHADGRRNLEAAVRAAQFSQHKAVDELAQLRAGQSQTTALQMNLAQVRADRDAALTAIATATSDAGAVQQRLNDVERKAAELTTLRGRLALLETELLEWRLLQQALDRDGLPALETDQAGPAISAVTNQILADCFESRFSVELVTQVAKADGKGMKDDFTLLVTDNHTGQVRDISDLSGGEEVIIAEAFMNAVAIFMNERSQTPIRTLFRDEADGALQPENRVRYIRMLRKVMELSGATQILFITHDPDVKAMADAQVRIADGQVTTVLPPYMAA